MSVYVDTLGTLECRYMSINPTTKNRLKQTFEHKLINFLSCQHKITNRKVDPAF